MRSIVLPLAGGIVIACAQRAEPANESSIDLLRYDRAVLLEQEAATSANVSIGDLDRDGHLDFVLVKGRHWPLQNMLLLGDGAGGFQPARAFAEIADRWYSGELVNIDADGDLDIVISNDQPDPNVVYLNDGNGAFEAARDLDEAGPILSNGRVDIFAWSPRGRR